MAGDLKCDHFNYFDVQITPNRGYVLSCERAEQVLREFETHTTCKYSCYKSGSSFGKTGKIDSYHSAGSSEMPSCYAHAVALANLCIINTLIPTLLHKTYSCRFKKK